MAQERERGGRYVDVTVSLHDPLGVFLKGVQERHPSIGLVDERLELGGVRHEIRGLLRALFLVPLGQALRLLHLEAVVQHVPLHPGALRRRRALLRLLLLLLLQLEDQILQCRDIVVQLAHRAVQALEVHLRHVRLHSRHGFLVVNEQIRGGVPELSEPELSGHDGVRGFTLPVLLLFLRVGSPTEPPALSIDLAAPDRIGLERHLAV